MLSEKRRLSQYKAIRAYAEKMKAKGYVRVTFWIKPKWRETIEALILKLSS